MKMPCIDKIKSPLEKQVRERAWLLRRRVFSIWSVVYDQVGLRVTGALEE